MAFSFRPAKSVTDRHGVFVSLTGGTNSGKSFSALRLARGIAGPTGKIAVLDSEGGRTLHLRDFFDFDYSQLDPPYRPQIFADGAKQAEDAGYDCLIFDTFSSEWAGLGGVRDWHEEELQGIVERAKQRRDKRSEYAIREAAKFAAWIKPKGAHKAMVYSLLQRRIPIVFAIRGEDTVKPGEQGEKPVTIFKSICAPSFPFEVTVSFRLDSERKGYINLSDPKSWKMEQAHREIFHDGEQISEEHGAALARWACGQAKIGPTSTPRAETAWIGPPLTALEEPDGAVWLANLERMLADAQSPQAVDWIRRHHSVGTATAKAPPSIRVRVSEMLASASMKFPADAAPAGADTDLREKEI
jgi:hypothetical protein